MARGTSRIGRGWQRATTALAATMLLTGGLLAAGTTSAAAVDNNPCSSRQVYRVGHLVQYCPLWQSNVPVFASPDQGAGAEVVGHLVKGGWANWFVGDHYASEYRYGSYANRWWAYTLADNGRWGWVPEVYFDGGDNYEGDAGLHVCGAAGNQCS